MITIKVVTLLTDEDLNILLNSLRAELKRAELKTEEPKTEELKRAEGRRKSDVHCAMMEVVQEMQRRM